MPGAGTHLGLGYLIGLRPRDVRDVRLLDPVGMRDVRLRGRGEVAHARGGTQLGLGYLIGAAPPGTCAMCGCSGRWACAMCGRRHAGRSRIPGLVT